MKRKKYLVLGSSGQIGGMLVQHLQSMGHQVLTFDIDTSRFEDLRYKNALLYNRAKEADFVFFLAFDVGGSRYLQKYQHTYEFIHNNTAIMQHTFDVLHELDKPFIFASSQMASMSYSPYGILKTVGESYTKSLNGLVVKFWNVYGIEHDEEKLHVITDFILSAKNNKQINMLTDGQEERQMLYAEDCCKCLNIIADLYDMISRNEELHITSFEWVKIIDIANIIAEEFPETVVTPSIKTDTVQKNARNEPDKSIFKYWKPETTIEDGIKQIINKMESI
jgi:nucleoside-diphosphate-sugar epimerase